jgi:RNA polymerase subunit RPABC4/transcription elongation factor Spt4
MGSIYEWYFDGIDKCPFCNSKKLRAEVIGKPTIIHADLKKCDYWEEELGYYETEYKIFCDKCKKMIDEV